MKRNLCIIILLMSLSILRVWGADPGKVVNFSSSRMTLSEALSVIEQTGGFSITYNESLLDLDRQVDTPSGKTVEELLPLLLAGSQAEARIKGNMILIGQKGPQPVERKGTVVDALGPLVGAVVMVEGTGAAVTTDLDGNFSLPAAAGNVLKVSLMGYQEASYKVGQETQGIRITLVDDVTLLDEVVVVGYDVQKKVNLTGAVASLSTEAIENKPIVQASTALQGAVPGVTVTTHGGAPGADTGNIRIRGIGTFGGSSAEPLVLIDGVEGSLNSVEAGDIDKISVLKDAASSAIYGSRAANGVILITTKRAEKGKASVQYRGYVGWQTPTTTPETVGPIDYMKLNREATENDGGVSIYTDEYIANYLKNNWLDPDNYPIVNWKERILNGSGLIHNHNLSLSASHGKVHSLTSVSFLDQYGIIKSASYKRVSLRNNMNIDITDRLSMRFDLSGSWGLRQSSPYQSTAFGFLNARDPLFLAQWSNGTYAPFTGGTVNILPVVDQGQGGNERTDAYRINGALALTWKPWPFLTLEGTVAPRLTLNYNHEFVDLITYYSDPYGTVSPIKNREYNSLTESHTNTFYGNYLFTARYHQKFVDAHDLTLLVGASYEDMDQRTLSAYRRDFAYPEYQTINAGADNEYKENGGARYQWALMSFFGRVNYNYKERYLFEANIRFDGSSRFARGKRWGIFPSFSAAWRLTEEPWMASAKKVLNEFKIRASYGQLGNQNIGSDYYPTVQTLTISSISANNIIYPIVGLNSLANKDITWESSEMYDIGIDATLWDRFSLTADGYYKTTRGILMQLDIPASIGLSAPYQNAGVVRNIGWELGLGYHDKAGDFSWGLDANLSDVYNKIVSMKGTASGNLLRNEEGYPINSIYGLKCIGMARTQDEADAVNATCPQYSMETLPGDLIYEDIAGDFDENGNPIPDGKIDDQDRQIIGSTVPRYTFGFTLNFGWNGISLTAQFSGVGMLNAYLSGNYTQPCVQGGTFRTEHLDRWTPSNPNGRFPRLSYTSELSRKNSSFWMADASYLRLKNIQLSYSFPKKWLAKTPLSKVSIFANATNVFTLTRYWQGYDPENMFTNSGDGVQAGATANNYPLVSTITFGVDIKF